MKWGGREGLQVCYLRGIIIPETYFLRTFQSFKFSASVLSKTGLDTVLQVCDAEEM